MSPPAGAICMQKGEYALLQVVLPGRPPEAAGVLLFDPASGSLLFRLRRDWDAIAGEEDAELLSLLAADLAAKEREMGGRKLLEYLEDSSSNFFRVTSREEVLAGSLPSALERLYRRHVSPKVLQFRTHLPIYSARAAAGYFGGEMEVEPEGWEEAPEDLKLTPDMFAVHVTGRSMEPRIPDGSVCAFCANVTGSRQGRLLLIENFGLPEHGGRYTVKRYRSKKNETPEAWEHAGIRLEPLNPEFEAWELKEGDFRVLGEFVRVLRTEEAEDPS